MAEPGNARILTPALSVHSGGQPPDGVVSAEVRIQADEVSRTFPVRHYNTNSLQRANGIADRLISNAEAPRDGHDRIRFAEHRARQEHDDPMLLATSE